MIIGAVNQQREPRIPLTLLDSNAKQHVVDAVVDTGFTGSITLPRYLISALGLVRRGYGRAILADGRAAIFDVYAVPVIWLGATRNVEVEAADTDPLVGMAILAGSDLHITCLPRGPVEIRLHV